VWIAFVAERGGGHDDFDDAADEVAKQMAWTPARVDSGSPDYYRHVSRLNAQPSFCQPLKSALIRCKSRSYHVIA